MRIRPFHPDDLDGLVDLTIDTFGPFYEQSFRPAVGEVVFRHQHGDWREDYRAEVPGFHAPQENRWVAVAEDDDGLAGYVGWSADPERGRGQVTIVAVRPGRRRSGLGTALCEHAFADLRARGVGIVAIGTGGDAFHAPARALYERLGCTPFPGVYYFREL